MFLHVTPAAPHLQHAWCCSCFGGPVEEENGGAGVPLLLSAVRGSAVATLSFLLMQWARVGLILGASGATLGVTFAFAWYWPKYPVFMFPPARPHPRAVAGDRHRGLDLVLAWAGALTRAGVSDPIAHLAHLGGVATALLYLKGQQWWVTRGERRGRQNAGVERPGLAAAPRAARSGAVPPSARTTKAQRERCSGKPPRSIACSIRSTRAASRASRPAERKFLTEISRRNAHASQGIDRDHASRWALIVQLSGFVPRHLDGARRVAAYRRRHATGIQAHHEKSSSGGRRMRRHTCLFGRVNYARPHCRAISGVWRNSATAARPGPYRTLSVVLGR